MSDRELLEQAAKAAEVDWFRRTDGGMWLKSGGIWNPITDDGDALRLVVKLGLDVCIDSRQEHEPHTHVIGFRDDRTATTIDAIEAHGDPYAATRRAIVRAAAEIGKEMK